MGNSVWLFYFTYPPIGVEALNRPVGFTPFGAGGFEGVFSVASFEEETVDKNATLTSTLRVLPRVIKQYSAQAAQAAQLLQGSTRRECAQNIWEFCFWYFNYTEDKTNHEQIRTPARSWADRLRGIDCDDFTVLSACLLSEMIDPLTQQPGIETTLRIAKYPDATESPEFSHIYVVVGDGADEIVIDPVQWRFDYEDPFIEKIDIDMKLQVLSGVPSVDLMDLGLGTPRRGAKWDRLHRDAQKTGKTVEEVIEQNRRDFTAKHGKTPEEFEREVKQKMEAARAESKRRQEAELEKLRSELTARGVGFSPDDTRETLMKKINESTRATKGPGLIHKLNKKNPIAKKLRDGLISGLQRNALNVALKLSYALDGQREAVAAGLAANDHDKIRKAWRKLLEIYYHAGGLPEELTAAVRQGSATTAEQLSGLPLPAAGKIVSSTAAIAAIAALLKKVKVPPRGNFRTPGAAVAVDEVGKQTGVISASVGDESASVTVHTPPTPPKPKSRIPRWVKGLGVLLGVGGLAGGGYVIFRKSKAKPKEKSSDKPAKKPTKTTSLNGSPAASQPKPKPVKRIRIK